MSNFSIAAEVQHIEETVKEELLKASMHLRGEFQEQLNMERQDRQVMLAKIRRDIEQQGSAISTVTEKVGAFSHSHQISEQQEVVGKFESQQHAMEKILQENELFAGRMSAAETTIAELQKAVAGYATIHQHVMCEAARQSTVHADIIQYVEAEIHDQVKQLRRESNSQRLQLDDQSAKFTTIAAEIETLRLRLAAVESSPKDVQRAGGARSPPDLSMQSELHSHVVALKETVAELRSDVAVQSSMKTTEHLLQQEGLESLRKEVSKLKLCTTPAAATMNMSLEHSIQKLREDIEKKFAYLEQQTPIGIASTIADALSKRFADNTHKAERMDKLVESGQPTNLAGADGNQELQEGKERDVSLSFNSFVAAGEWSAAKEASLEEMSKHSSEASSSDPDTAWIPGELKKSLATLVDSIQSNLKMQAKAPASPKRQNSRGGSASPHLACRGSLSPRFLQQSLLQTSSCLKSDASVHCRASCSSPTRTPTSAPSGTSQSTSTERSDSSCARVPPITLASVASRAASRPETAVLGVGAQAGSGPNKEFCRTNQLGARKASGSPQSMSRSRTYGLGGQHTLGRNESGGLMNKARMASPISNQPFRSSLGGGVRIQAPSQLSTQSTSKPLI